MKFDQLEHYGIDFKKGFERCMNDEEFYVEYLSMLLEDDCYSRALEAYRVRDYDTMFKCMHELKGVCGNAELFGLYEQVCPLVELLRNHVENDEIGLQLQKVTEAYQKTLDGIASMKE